MRRLPAYFLLTGCAKPLGSCLWAVGFQVFKFMVQHTPGKFRECKRIPSGRLHLHSSLIVHQ